MNTPKTNHGFTLIEVLIAGAILVLAGVSAILLERQAINSSAFNKHRLQALGLAQEGINKTRAQFYSNLLDPAKTGSAVWDGLTGCTDATPCYLDSSGNLTNTASTLEQNNINFTRKIYIEAPPAP